jgi:hypothetical protein
MYGEPVETRVDRAWFQQIPYYERPSSPKALQILSVSRPPPPSRLDYKFNLRHYSSEVGITLDTLPVGRGYYRFSAHTDKIRECPDNDLCKVGHTCACAGSTAAVFNGTRSPDTAGDALCAGRAWQELLKMSFDTSTNPCFST